MRLHSLWGNFFKREKKRGKSHLLGALHVLETIAAQNEALKSEAAWDSDHPFCLSRCKPSCYQHREDPFLGARLQLSACDTELSKFWPSHAYALWFFLMSLQAGEIPHPLLSMLGCGSHSQPFLPSPAVALWSRHHKGQGFFPLLVQPVVTFWDPVVSLWGAEKLECLIR